LIDFKWTSGRWKYVTKEAANNQLMMNDHHNQCRLLEKLIPSEARRTIGVYLAPEVN